MKKPLRFLCLGCALVVALLVPASVRSATEQPTSSEYVVVVSRKTHEDAAWRKVVEALAAKHKAQVIQFDGKVADCLPRLREVFPKYTCFVAKPTDVTRHFVADVHILTRQFDDDPYTDVLWGILTGFDADNAYRIATQKEPLTIRKVASGTEIALDQCAEGVWFSELQAGHQVRKNYDGSPTVTKGPTDSTRLLADTLVKEKADLFVTSGHATERDWQIGFRYRNGSFRSKDGALFGVDVAGQRFAIQSDHPRVYMAVGNCLMGHIDGPDAMALAFLKSAGVNQMVGYTVLTWYGYGGWGCLDYFVEQPGRYSLAEAFFANQQALIHRLGTYCPEGLAMKVEPGARPTQAVKLSPQAKAAGLSTQDMVGLIHDRDVVAFYGDPAWEARLAPGDCAWDQILTEKDGKFTLEVIPRKGAKTFAPVNTNGSQRGYRPIMALLPYRIKNIEVLEGKEYQPVINDAFVLVPNPRTWEEGKTMRVVFQAKRM